MNTEHSALERSMIDTDRLRAIANAAAAERAAFLGYNKPPEVSGYRTMLTTGPKCEALARELDPFVVLELLDELGHRAAVIAAYEESRASVRRSTIADVASLIEQRMKHCPTSDDVEQWEDVLSLMRSML